MMRQNDQTRERTPIRGNRYFKLHDFWYFATREGAMMGPFDSEEQARRATGEYIDFVQHAPMAAFQFLNQNNLRLSA